MSDDARELLVREFPVEVAEVGDGRTLEARIVPYNTPAKVVDLPQNGGTGIPYMESWAPGAFDRQSGALNRVKVWLNFEHQPGLQGVVGHGEELDSRPDGLYGTFRMHDDADGNKALGMVREGLLTGISLEAFSIRHRRTAEGIVERVRGHLDKVSLCRLSKAAFEGAQVLAVRETPSPDEPEPDAPEPAPEPSEPSEADSALQLSPDNPLPVTEPAPDDSALEPAESSQRQFTHEEVQEAAGIIERKTRVDELLERVGYEPILKRTVTTKAWDGSAARFSDSEYERSCLICRGGDEPPKTRCSLPVLEPDGTLNVHALGAAAGRLNQLTNATTAQKAAAARKLRRLYGQAEMDPPPSVMAMAGRA
jgi:HK97 family phage prohead protease